MPASPSRTGFWPRSTALIALALGLFATPALAQLDPSRFQLELSLVGRRYSNHVPNVSMVATDVPTASAPIDSHDPDPLARTVRLEIRYRILVLGSTTGTYVGADGTTYSSAGLCNSAFRLTSTRALNPGDLRAAQIETGAATAPAANPTTVDLTDGNLGLYRVFRTGVFSDSPPGSGLGGSNGAFSATGLTTILPVTLSAPNQLSGTFDNSRIWGTYAVDLIVPFDAADGTYTFFLGITPNSNWSFFPRSGSTTSAPISGTGGVSFATSTFSVSVNQIGSCCAPSGECTFIPHAYCPHPFIPAAVCQPHPCHTPGACCAINGPCTFVLVSDCTTAWIQGGVCQPNPCPQPGPCCATTGACTFVLQSLCAEVWNPNGVCVPSPCSQPGRCCHPTGACTFVLQGLCAAVWSPDGACTPNLCPQPGRCCAPTGACTFVLQSVCSAPWTQGGSCSPNPCPQPGSCCAPDRSCTFGLQNQCAFFWRSNGACAPNTCPVPCRVDFNGSVSVTVADIFAFLVAWFQNDPRTDFNNSGSVNIPDIFVFLTEWFAGCY